MQQFNHSVILEDISDVCIRPYGMICNYYIAFNPVYDIITIMSGLQELEILCD